MDKKPKRLKRTAWTNQEIINLIEGFKDADEIDGKLVVLNNATNQTLEMVQDTFYDFNRDCREMGAKAYCPEEDMIYHIGEKPER